MFRAVWIGSLILFLSLFGQSQSAFYDPAKIQKIEVFFQQQNWDQMLDTAKAGKDGFVMAKLVKINGMVYDSAGIKYKGNSSYDSTFKKNPIHIELNTFKDQDYEGWEDIKLSNAYADPSMVREVLAYDILKNYMPCPESNFAQLYINGNYIGLYSSSESINKTFCTDHFYTKDGTFIKANPDLTPSPSVKSNLKFLTGDSSAYYDYYEMKSDYGWKQLQALCDTVTNHPENISSVLNVDRVLWMLAFNNLFVNLDSYNGAFAQNYYLYKDHNGLYNPIVWDLNMCFGGFPFAGASNTSLANLNITSMQNFSASNHSSDIHWPLIKAVFGNPQYKKMYLAHLKTMCNEMVKSDLYISKYNYFKNIADTAVLSDPKKFYNYNAFQTALTQNISVGSYSVPGIQTLMSARNSYLQATSDFTVAQPAISLPVTGNPAIGQSITIKTSVTNANNVYLGYRYFASSTFTRVAMYDDGQHNDGAANDNVYGTSFLLNANHAQYYVYAENDNAAMFSPERAEHEFYNIDVYPRAKVGQVHINEFLASNKSDVTNEFHASEDWIELYNMSSAPISLANLYLSDDRKQKIKYKFPSNAVIKGEDLLIVWADEFVNGAQMHCGFKLDENGESIILSDGLKTIHDSYSFGLQEEDVSMARCPDGDGPFQYNKLPSYRLFNCLTGVDDKTANVNSLVIYPNPATDNFNIKSSEEETRTITVRNILGTQICNLDVTGEAVVDTKNWKPGIYFVTSEKETTKLIITK